MREEQANKSGPSSQTTSQASTEGPSGSASDTDYDDDDFYECSDNINDKVNIPHIRIFLYSFSSGI